MKKTTMPITTPVFLTLDEMAELFRTTPGGIYQRIHRTRRGRDSFPLPIRGLGKRNLWLKDEVARHIENCAAAPSPGCGGATKPESLAVLEKHGIGTK